MLHNIVMENKETTPVSYLDDHLQPSSAQEKSILTLCPSSAHLAL